MARIGKCGFPAFSPDGKTVAFVSDMSGVQQVWTVPVTGGWPERITALDDSVIGEQWSHERDWIALLDGSHNRHLYAVHGDGTGLKHLAANPSEVDVISDWTQDGQRIMLSANRDPNDVMKAYLVEPDSGQLKNLGGDETGLPEDVSKDNKTAIVYRGNGNGNNDLYRIDLATGADQLLTPHEGKAQYYGGYVNGSSARLSADCRNLYFCTTQGHKNPTLGRIKFAADGTAGKVEFIADRGDDFSLYGFKLNRKGTIAALLWNKDTKNQVSFLDLATLKTTAAPPLPVDQLLEWDFSPDDSLLAMSLQGTTSPEDVWVLNIKSGKYRQLTHSQHTGLNLADLVKPEKVSFKAADGTQLNGWLSKPRGIVGPAPYVVKLSGSGRYFDIDDQALLSRGIGVFTPLIREVDPFEGKDMSAVIKENSIEQEKSDIKSSVDYLVANGLADAKRIGVFGFSHGGRLSLTALAAYPEMFRAACDQSGVVDYQMLKKDSTTKKEMAGVTPAQEEEILQKLSPLYSLDRIKAPVMVQQGALDTYCKPKQAQQLVDNLKKNGTPCEFILLPDEGHVFLKTDNKVKTTVSMVEFFCRYLQPDKPTSTSMK